MPVKKDASGRRYVEAEVEVPGSPEEVWQAIATGPGISSWFVPSRIEERVGGTIAMDFGPGMESLATVTAWQPPHRYAAENRDETGPKGPPVATEWTVESRAGGTCRVRVVHSWFADSDEWDSQFAGHEGGWVSFFRILRLVLAHYRGQPSASFQVMAMTAQPAAEAWARLSGRLDAGGAAVGQRISAPPDAPALAGRVEHVGPAEHAELLLTLDRPAPGIAHLFAMPFGGQTCVSVRGFFFGADAAEVAAREEARWQAWVGEWLAAGPSTAAGASDG